VSKGGESSELQIVVVLLLLVGVKISLVSGELQVVVVLLLSQSLSFFF
jgi:hypothetical protein